MRPQIPSPYGGNRSRTPPRGRPAAPRWLAIITSLVLDGISSRHTRRAYSQALDEFLIWFRDDPNREFNKATVQKYRTELETKGLAASSINVRLSAIRRLALEAADNGLMAPEQAAGISRAKGAKRNGVRLGHWLTAEQAAKLLAAPDLDTTKGIRDRAVIALLIGAGLRRSEVAGLERRTDPASGRSMAHRRPDRQTGTDPERADPSWAHDAVTALAAAAGVTTGALFRRVTRHGFCHAGSNLATSRVSHRSKPTPDGLDIRVARTICGVPSRDSHTSAKRPWSRSSFPSGTPRWSRRRSTSASSRASRCAVRPPGTHNSI